MPIVKAMKVGFKISFVLCLFATFILSLYNTYPTSHIIYDSSLILFRTGLFLLFLLLCLHLLLIKLNNFTFYSCILLILLKLMQLLLFDLILVFL